MSTDKVNGCQWFCVAYCWLPLSDHEEAGGAYNHPFLPAIPPQPDRIAEIEKQIKRQSEYLSDTPFAYAKDIVMLEKRIDALESKAAPEADEPPAPEPPAPTTPEPRRWTLHLSKTNPADFHAASNVCPSWCKPTEVIDYAAVQDKLAALERVERLIAGKGHWIAGTLYAEVREVYEALAGSDEGKKP